MMFDDLMEHNMSQNEVKISLIQMKMVKDVSSNLKKAVSMIHEAANGGAEIVCLPELFSTQYFPQYDLSDNALRCNIPHDAVPGEICSVLSSAALDNNIILIGGSLFEKCNDHFFNTSVTFNSDGKLLGKYRKTHIPHDEKFYEQSYFEKGDTGFNS